MYDRLSQAHRKIVVISDPHIRKNDTYFFYQMLKDLENSVNNQEDEEPEKVKLLVRDPYKYTTSDDTFEGNCWPGKSVWPDFLQKKVR